MKGLSMKIGENRSQDKLLNEQQAAEILGLTPGALQAWRARKKGPPFYRISNRLVRYRIPDLYWWLEQQQRVTEGPNLRNA
jgi:predicted DNA-binding transcriptional regulator AlpA